MTANPKQNTNKSQIVAIKPWTTNEVRRPICTLIGGRQSQFSSNLSIYFIRFSILAPPAMLQIFQIYSKRVKRLGLHDAEDATSYQTSH